MGTSTSPNVVAVDTRGHETTSQVPTGQSNHIDKNHIPVDIKAQETCPLSVLVGKNV